MKMWVKIADFRNDAGLVETGTVETVPYADSCILCPVLDIWVVQKARNVKRGEM